jgi:uncharacterized membrane protein
MIVLILGLMVFLGAHSVRIVADDFRTRQIARLGELKWKGAFSVVSLAGFALIVWGYGLARAEPVLLWNPPPWTRYLAVLLTIPAFVLFAAAKGPVTRIKAAVGHPTVAGVKVWAVAHLIANGTLADVLLFGAFLAWAVADFAAARRRDRASGQRYQAGPIAHDVVAVVVGLAAWAVFALWLHAWLIGVRPLG